MGRINETVTTINSAVRTFLVFVIVGMIGTTAYFVYERISGADQLLGEARREIAAVESKLQEATTKITTLEVDVAEKARQISRMELAMNLLKTDQRLAKLDVLDQTTDADTGKTSTTIRFTELTPDGDSVGEPREFTLQGDMVYLDNWIVKFDDEYVEQADLLRGTSLALFRRVFGEFQTPNDGFILDEEGLMPQAYELGGEPGDFAKEIWKDFWSFANNPEAAKQKGIRAAHGEAVSMKVTPGKSYKIILRASDGLSIVPAT
jgi:hypothetical protein